MVHRSGKPKVAMTKQTMGEDEYEGLGSGGAGGWTGGGGGRDDDYDFM